MERKRINLSVSRELYVKLQHARSRGGFRNICELTTVLLNVFCDKMEDNEHRIEPEEDDNEEIRKMFEEFEYSEPFPDDVYVRHNNKKYGER